MFENKNTKVQNSYSLICLFVFQECYYFIVYVYYNIYNYMLNVFLQYVFNETRI